MQKMKTLKDPARYLGVCQKMKFNLFLDMKDRVSKQSGRGVPKPLFSGNTSLPGI